jgi:5-methylcytosine-specific restriction endonuclease McrA
VTYAAVAYRLKPHTSKPGKRGLHSTNWPAGKRVIRNDSQNSKDGGPGGSVHILDVAYVAPLARIYQVGNTAMSDLETTLAFHCTKCKKKKASTDFYVRHDSGKRNPQCKKCICERERIRRAENIDHVRSIGRKSYQKNKEAYIHRAKKWAKENPERRREIANHYALKNLDKISAWSRANPEKLREGSRRGQAKRRAMQVKTGGVPTRTQIQKVKSINDGACVYCGNTASCIDHFIPVIKGGWNRPNNLVPACGSCNGKKGTSDPDQWVIKNHGLKKLNWIKGLLHEQS